MRERVPSTTLTWTFSVSPGRNSGMSERFEAASRASSVCIGISSLAVPQVTHGGGGVVWRSCREAAPSLWRGCSRLTAASQSATGPVTRANRPSAGAQPSSASSARSCLSRPSGSRRSSRSGRRSAVRRSDSSRRQRAIRRVVAGQQHRRHLPVPPGRGLRVAGRLEQPAGVRLLDQRLGVADHPGQQPGHRLDDRQHRHLAAVEDVVAQAHLGDPAAARRPRRAPAGRCPRSARRRRPARARPRGRAPSPG